MQRSIWISTEDWELIRTAAAVAKQTLSQYLLHLHKMNITSRGISPPAILADPLGAIVTTPADQLEDGKVLIVSKDNMKLPGEPEKPLKEAVIVNIEPPEPEIPSAVFVKGLDNEDFFNPRPKGQDGKKKKG